MYNVFSKFKNNLHVFNKIRGGGEFEKPGIGGSHKVEEKTGLYNPQFGMHVSIFFHFIWGDFMWFKAITCQLLLCLLQLGPYTCLSHSSKD